MSANTLSAEEHDRLSELIAKVLLVGNVATVALLVVGSLLAVLRPQAAGDRSHTLSEAWRSLLQAHPGGFLEVGLQLVVLTPIATSIAITFYAIFHRRKELWIPSLLIVGGVGLGLWIGLAQ